VIATISVAEATAGRAYRAATGHAHVARTERSIVTISRLMLLRVQHRDDL